jgi:hypothetical protein
MNGFTFEEAPLRCRPSTVRCGRLAFLHNDEGVYPLEDCDDRTIWALVMAPPMEVWSETELRDPATGVCGVGFTRV